MKKVMSIIFKGMFGLAVIISIIYSAEYATCPAQKMTVANPESYTLRINESGDAMQLLYEKKDVNDDLGHEEYYDIDPSKPYIVLTDATVEGGYRRLEVVDNYYLVFPDNECNVNPGDEVIYNRVDNSCVPASEYSGKMSTGVGVIVAAIYFIAAILGTIIYILQSIVDWMYDINNATRRMMKQHRSNSNLSKN